MTISELLAYLDATDRGYAKFLVLAMTIEAQRDEEYRHHLAKWLAEGGTLILRDQLARKFQDAAFVHKFADRFRYPWDEMWTALDTASLNIRRLKAEKSEEPTEN